MHLTPVPIVDSFVAVRHQGSTIKINNCRWYIAVTLAQEMHNLKAECHELSSQLEGMEAHRQKVLRDFQQLQEASRRTAPWLSSKCTV